jgi:hypothetical protein
LENGKFPPTSAMPTPAKSCCEENFQGKRKCAPNPANWSTQAWQELDFQITEPHFFRYGYHQLAPDQFTATATGDLDCDGTAITYTLTGSAPGGQPNVVLTRPPPNSD